MTILRLAVGLGNPGDEYRGTRHNVGFEVIERAARDLGVRFSRFRGRGDSGKNLGQVAEDEERGFAILEPTTFMNVSGVAVASACNRYGIEPSSILVICDDFHLSLGRLRVRPKGSAGGHNGLRSILGSLGTEEFPRIRIGIGETEGPWEHYVLSKFRKEERLPIEEAIETTVGALSRWCLDGDFARLMNSLNSPPGGAVPPRAVPPRAVPSSGETPTKPEVRKNKPTGSPERPHKDPGSIQKNQP
jgi:PTH1 family peptidyl-tRNA hydrolase